MEKSKKCSISRIIFLALFAAVLIFTQAIAASAETFPDVKSDHYAYNAVEEAASKGYVLGYEDGNFRPGVTLTREHGALVFSRVLKTDTDNLDKVYFSDVPMNHRSYKEISGIARDKIINGYGDGTFKPFEPLSRGQVALAIYRTFDFSAFKNYKDVPFGDIKGTIYEEAVSVLYNAKVTNGIGNNSFGVNDTITRADFITLLTNAQAAVHKDKTIKNVQVKVNENQTATVYGAINDFKLDGTELVNIKINSKADNKQLVNIDVKPSNLEFSYTTSVLKTGKYEAKVSIVGSTHIENLEFEITDTIAPAAPGISFVGKSVVGDVVDLLDLKTDLTARYTFTTEDVSGAKVGDTLTYKVSSASDTIEKSVTLTQQDIDRGYVEHVIKTNALQNLLGGLLGGTVGDLSGVLGASTNVSAASTDQTVTSAGLLDGLLGGVTKTVGGVVGSVVGGNADAGGLLDGGLGGVVGGVTDTAGGLLNTDDLLGLEVGGLVSGVVELVDGVLVTVVDGVIVDVVGGVVDGVVGGLISGSEEVTIEVKLIDAAKHESPITKKVYKFQVSDVVGIL